MFRSICKYTPLLRRIFIFALALLFLIPCFFKPIPVKAIPFADPATAALLSWYIGSGFISDSMEDLAAVLAEFIGKLKSGFSDIYDQDYTLQFLQDLAMYGNRSSFVLRENQSKLLKSLAMLIINNSLFYGKILHKEVDLEKDDLKEEEIPFVEHDVPLYVPNEEYLQNALTIEQAQVLYKGFETGMAALSADLTYQLQLLNISLGHRMQLLREYIHDMNDYLGWKIEDVGQILKNMRSQLSTDLTDLRLSLASNLEYQNQIIKNRFIELNDNIITLKNTFNNRFVELKSSVEALPRQIGNVISDQFDSLQLSIEHLTETFPALQQRLDQILEKIPVYEEIEVVQKPQIEVQVGQQQILVQDYASMGQAFSAKMAWVPQIFDFLSELRSRLNSGTAPKVAIDLSDAEGSYNYGDKVYVLDMSWYARYKPSVDTFLSGVMWICFGWAIYKRIPDILSGVGLTVENATETRGHVWADRAEREASLSYRQERRSDYYAKKNNKGG